MPSAESISWLYFQFNLHETVYIKTT